ncbi:related to meiosis-specific protein NDT80 [Rhynchosporium secalis]|uniref:Related to meiosis-specific protein NDT80 n=1 Tax=Rhynchosporium secalis TaxID=38038 RepID=A0A1E1MJ67_RHYSE|nr:related to meiosis-specific protein NDT80 [Rhynchosporium secalis]
MGSQAGNYQDLAASSGLSPSCIIGSETEGDNSSRNDYSNSHSQPLSTDMQQYMDRVSTDDVRYPSEAGTSHSPVYSLEPAVQNTNPSSTLAFAPYTQLYHHQPLNGNTYTSGGSYHFAPNTSLFSMPDLKPRQTSFASSGLAPLSRSPALPQPSIPINPRDIYGGAQPHLRRPSDLLRSPTLSHSYRGVPLSPSSTSGFTSPISNMDGSLGGAPCPPLGRTEVLYTLQTSDGQVFKPEIFGKIDKGFFLAEKDWTCYRRNYFSLNCSYTITPSIPNGSMYLVQHNGSGPQIQAFAMSIAAVVDGRDGKSIELVQHTPKRDKGPQEKPARITLAPRPAASHGMYGDSSMGSRAGIYDNPGFSQNPNQPAVEATFERIQFKNATANNGKRRAAQQYYHLLVELFVDVGNHHPDRWVKIASRMSAPMVVRGRSPGHYQGERRGSNGSAGPGSSAGQGGGSYTPSGSTNRTSGDMNMGGGSMLPGSGYSYNDNRGGYHRSGMPPLHDPTLSHDEEKSIAESSCFMYYPGAIYEGHEQKYTLPSVSDYTTSKINNDYSGAGGYVLPSITSSTDGYVRQCGRWDGMESSRGYYPTTILQRELNLSV